MQTQAALKKLAVTLAAAAGLAGIAASPASAVLIITPNLQDFGSIVVGKSSAAFEFTLTNDCAPDVGGGGGCLAGTGSPFDTDTATVTGDFARAGGTCTGTLNPLPPPGAMCTLAVTFNPTTVGTRMGTLNASTGISSLSGTGLAPAATPATPTTPPILSVALPTPGRPGFKKAPRCKSKKSALATAAKKKCKKRKN